MYRLFPSNATRTSVDSLAGCPSCGSLWTKPLTGFACCHAASSRMPSTTTGVAVRVARISRRPSGARSTRVAAGAAAAGRSPDGGAAAEAGTATMLRLKIRMSAKADERIEFPRSRSVSPGSWNSTPPFGTAEGEFSGAP